MMALKVDLQCPKCYKKVKKLLCKFPQIRDQAFDEKNNMVIITVVCYRPEKLRDKLCRKGGGVIKSIEIAEPPKPKEPQKPKEAEKPKEKPPPPPPPVPPLCLPPMVACCGCPCFHGYGWPPPCYCGRPVYGGYVFCEENTSACTIM